MVVVGCFLRGLRCTWSIGMQLATARWHHTAVCCCSGCHKNKAQCNSVDRRSSPTQPHRLKARGIRQRLYHFTRRTSFEPAPPTQTHLIPSLLMHTPSLLPPSLYPPFSSPPANMRVLRGILGKPKVSRLLPILLDAPNLLTRSHSALEAAWTTLHGELGLDAARALLFGDPLAAGSAASPDAAAAPGDAAADLNGAGGDVCGGAPRLLAYSKEALVARIGMLRRLRELSDDWKERVDDVMGHTGQLGAVLGAPQRAFERLSWLEESKMTRAPGGMRLVDLMTLGDVAFRDLYPSWPGAGEGAEAETGR